MVTIYPSQQRGHLPLIDHKRDDIFYFSHKSIKTHTKPQKFSISVQTQEYISLDPIKHLQSELSYAVILTLHDLHILAYDTKPSLGTMKYFKIAGSVQCNDYIVIHN